jgi:hypothetical protein
MITFEQADQYTERRARDAAFADALAELFKRYPIPEHSHDMHHAVRGSALRKARAGGYADYAPGGMDYWRRQVMENAREDWNVPMEEVVTIHALIYG